MFIKSSYADFLRAWRSLLGAAAENVADLPEIERHRLALQQKVEAVEAEKVRQEAAQVESRVRTQSLRTLMLEADELAKRLQGVAMANVGPRNERLSQFGVAPLGKRRRSRKPVEVPPPKETPEAAPPAPAGPPAPQPATTTN